MGLGLSEQLGVVKKNLNMAFLDANCGFASNDHNGRFSLAPIKYGNVCVEIGLRS